MKSRVPPFVGEENTPEALQTTSCVTGLSHLVQRIEKVFCDHRWYCSICNMKWGTKPRALQRCPGVPVLSNKEHIQQQLYTCSELQKLRSMPRPGTTPVACYLSNNRYVWLYSLDNCIIDHTVFYDCTRSYITEYFNLNDQWLNQLNWKGNDEACIDFYQVRDFLWRHRVEYFIYLDQCRVKDAKAWATTTEQYQQALELHHPEILKQRPDYQPRSLFSIALQLNNCPTLKLFLLMQQVVVDYSDEGVKSLLRLFSVRNDVKTEVLLYGLLREYQPTKMHLATAIHKVLYPVIEEVAA